MSDETLRALQIHLQENPHAGKCIPGCGLLRKVRFGDPLRHKGTRSGFRVIYMNTPEIFRIDLLTLYGKDEAENLSPRDVREFCKIAKLIRQEALSAYKLPLPRQQRNP